MRKRKTAAEILRNNPYRTTDINNKNRLKTRGEINQMNVVMIFFNIAIIVLVVAIMRRWLTAGMGMAGYFFDTYILGLGTIHHELSHAFAGVLTGAKITSVNVFQIDPVTRSLGSVEMILSRNLLLRNIQAFFVSLAPLYMSCITCTLLSKFLLAPWYNGEIGFLQMINTLQFWLYVILATPILVHADLSFQDIKVGLPGIIFIFILLFIINLFMPGLINSILIAVTNLRNSMFILMIIPFILGLISKFMI